jgi:hypothetical protein
VARNMVFFDPRWWVGVGRGSSTRDRQAVGPLICSGVMRCALANRTRTGGALPRDGGLRRPCGGEMRRGQRSFAGEQGVKAERGP